MKTNQLNNVWIFVVFLLFINSCFSENALRDSVSENDVLLVINDEGITLKNFRKVFDKQRKIFRIQT